MRLDHIQNIQILNMSILSETVNFGNADMFDIHYLDTDQVKYIVFL